MNRRDFALPLVAVAASLSACSGASEQAAEAVNHLDGVSIPSRASPCPPCPVVPGACDDAPALNAAIDALELTGGVLQLEAREYLLCESGLQVNGPVSIVGRGKETVLRLGTSAYPKNKVVLVESVFTPAVYNFTGALVAGQRTFLLDGAAGLAAGDEVMVFAGRDPYDPIYEEIIRMFNVVESVSGTTVTLRSGLPEPVPAPPPSAPHTLRKLERIAQGTRYQNFSIEYVANVELHPDQGIVVSQARHVRVDNIHSVSVPGSMVAVAESEDVQVNGLYAGHSERELHVAAGRLINGYGMRDCVFRDVFGEDVEGSAVFFESHVRGALLENLRVSAGSGTLPGIPAVHVVGGSTGVTIRNYHFDSSEIRRPAAWVAEAATLQTEDVFLWRNNKGFGLEGHAGGLLHEGTHKYYLEARTARVQGQLPRGEWMTMALPYGVYKDVRVYVSSTTDILNFYVVEPGGYGEDMKRLLRDGSWVRGPVTLRSVGSDFPFNDSDTKRLAILTGASVPEGASFMVDVDYIEPGFLDVPLSHPFHDFIHIIQRRGMTSGCEAWPPKYCPDAAVAREQMAAFLLRAKYGSEYTPPAATGVFSDVPVTSPFAPWIEKLYRDRVTGGCATNPLRYCPEEPVWRSQIAVFLLRTLLGPDYVPPDAIGIFSDVPVSDPFARWIEDLYKRSIAGGCATNPLRYCPQDMVTRGQLAVFLVRTFDLL